MENNTIQSVRGLSSILEGLKPGAPLVRVIGVGEEKALWTGTVLVRDVGEFALLYNIGEGTIDYARLDADQGWRIDGSADGSVPSESVGELVSLLGSKVLGSQRSLILRQKAEVDLNNFKSTTRQTLIDYFEDKGEADEVDEILDGLGLEGRTRIYQVRVRISYEVDVEVEATSEEEAQEKVDDDTYLATDQVDTSYYEDFEVQSVDEA